MRNNHKTLKEQCIDYYIQSKTTTFFIKKKDKRYLNKKIKQAAQAGNYCVEINSSEFRPFWQSDFFITFTQEKEIAKEERESFKLLIESYCRANDFEAYINENSYYHTVAIIHFIEQEQINAWKKAGVING